MYLKKKKEEEQTNKTHLPSFSFLKKKKKEERREERENPLIVHAMIGDKENPLFPTVKNISMEIRIAFFNAIMQHTFEYKLQIANLPYLPVFKYDRFSH